MKMNLIRYSHIAASFGLLCSVLPGETLILEDFGGTGALNETTPDVTPGGDWVASEQFAADGVISAIGTGINSGGSATVAFTPVDGLIYTLDASFTGVTGGNDWVALGFGDGQSATQSSGNRFINNNLIGKAWMLFRGDLGTNENQRFAGSSTNGTSGISAPWTASFTVGGDIDMRIELDTTGGSGNWNAIWLAKRPTDAEYTEVGASAMQDETITSVGIAHSNAATTATVTSFSLSNNATPPVSLPSILGIATGLEGEVILTLDGPAEGLQAQKSNNLLGFADVTSSASGNTLTISATEVDLDGDGTEFYRIREQ